MATPRKIRKLDETVINRIAAGEIIQRPSNALKELLENSIDAHSTNIQVSAKDGGLKLLQIQDNGTGINVSDLDIVCERFTTSKLQNFDDLHTISTYGFRGEALASISHVAQLTIITKTAKEKCAYKASYLDSKLKGPPVACAGNQGTIITVENLFYNVATRRKALSNTSEEFSKISDVITKYAIHNSSIGFTLKKHGETATQIRTPQSSTIINNIRQLYGNNIAKELLEIELNDDKYKFKLHALITNANYSSKKLMLILFINNRLVESNALKKTIEDLYTVYLPKKAHPWCYISLQIDPQNVDVNIHPTKHEVRFLHEDIIIEKIKIVLDEKLASNDASRTFYIQAKLPKFDVTIEDMKEALPNTQKESDKTKTTYAKDMIRMDSSDQKLDKFNFTCTTQDRNNVESTEIEQSAPNVDIPFDTEDYIKKDVLSNLSVALESSDLKESENQQNHNLENSNNSNIDFKISKNSNVDFESSEDSDMDLEISKDFEMDLEISKNPNVDLKISKDPNVDSKLSKNSNMDLEISEDSDMDLEISKDSNVDLKISKDSNMDLESSDMDLENSDIDLKILKNSNINPEILKKNDNCLGLTKNKNEITEMTEEINTSSDESKTEEGRPPVEFKSYSVNDIQVETKLLSVLTLRKEIEDTYHEGLREVLSNLIFVGCVDECSALIQSKLKLYICNTQKLVEELFYEIMLYDFANFGVIKFSEPLLIQDLATLGLDLEEAGWTEEVGEKSELGMRVQELLLEKADMLRQYFSIYIDKKGYLKSLPILIENYFPNQAEIPLYLLRLSTEVNWSKEKPCFHDICRETAKFYSKIDITDDSWKNVTENILYNAIKESLLPPKHFLYDSTILEIANLPSLYKVFERC